MRIEQKEREIDSHFTVETEQPLPYLTTSIFLPRKTLSSYDLAENYGIGADFVDARLGTQTIYEMEDRSILVPEVMAINAIQKSGEIPDVFVSVESHIRDNPQWLHGGDVRPAWQVANRLRYGLETTGFIPHEEENPKNTFNVSAACSGGVAAMVEIAGGVVECDGEFIEIEGRVPDGERVHMSVNETNYRNHLPEANQESDPGKSRMLFSEVGVDWDFEKGMNGVFIYPGMLQYVYDEKGGLRMDISEEEIEDPYLVQYRVPYAPEFQMNGQAVSRHFTPRLRTEEVLGYLDFADIDPEQVVSLHSHQASRYMLDKVFSQFPEDIFPRLTYKADKLAEYGNMSAASSFVTMAEMLRGHELQFGPDDVHLWVQFGAGYTNGFSAVRLR